MPSPPCIIRTKTIAHCEILQLTCLPQGKNESKCEQMIRRQRLDERRHSKKTHTHKLDNTAKAHLTATFMGAGRASSAPAAAIATQVATDPRTTGAAKAA